MVVEAIRWTGGNLAAVARFLGLSMAAAEERVTPTGQVWIKTLEGTMRANRYDFIIRGIGAEFYPCKPEIFLQTYEPAITVEVDLARLAEEMAEEFGMPKEEVFALARDLLDDDSRGERPDEANN